MTRHPADLGDERLAALLTAASAPARPGELDREEEVVRAYRSFRPTPPPARARRVIARVAIVKTVVALAMLGGVALAAKSSRIPEPPETAQQTGTTAAGERDLAGDAPVPLATEEPTSAVEPPTTTAPPSDTPGAGLQWLCRLFLDDRLQARHDPGFPGLIDEAGGRWRVGEFCRDLLGLPENEEDREEGDEGEGEGDDGKEDATPPVPDPGDVHKGPKPPAERTLVPLSVGAVRV